MQGRVTGPFSMDKLRELRARGVFQPFHEVSADKAAWAPASSLGDIFAATPPFMAEAPAKGANDWQNPGQSAPSAQPWFYLDDRKEQVGPVEAGVFPSLVSQGTVRKKSLVWSPGMAQWLEARVALPHLFHAAPSTDQASFDQPNMREKKNRVVAILLAWFLGLFGIHQFYLGNSGKGVTYLVLTILVIPIPVIAILCLIDIITIATSKDPMLE